MPSGSTAVRCQQPARVLAQVQATVAGEQPKSGGGVPVRYKNPALHRRNLPASADFGGQTLPALSHEGPEVLGDGGGTRLGGRAPPRRLGVRGPVGLARPREDGAARPTVLIQTSVHLSNQCSDGSNRSGFDRDSRS